MRLPDLAVATCFHPPSSSSCTHQTFTWGRRGRNLHLHRLVLGQVFLAAGKVASYEVDKTLLQSATHSSNKNNDKNNTVMLESSESCLRRRNRRGVGPSLNENVHTARRATFGHCSRRHFEICSLFRWLMLLADTASALPLAECS